MSHRPNHRRGSAVLVVMWALALAAFIVGSVQLLGYRTATLGQQALGRVQARWAARGGLEQAIAIMTEHTEFPVPDDAFALVRALGYAARGDLQAGGRILASWDIRHHIDGQDWAGPMDEHAKINVNAALADPSLLMTVFEDMTPDIIDAILDWMDEDDEPRAQGAEKYYYQAIQTIPYQPRNAPFRTTAELELAAGIWPEHLRGEDWNFDNRLDANENDGDRTWPFDDADEWLDAGWSAFLTTHSVRGGPAASGFQRLRLRDTTPEELTERLDLSDELASQLLAWARDRRSSFEQLLVSYAQPEQSRSSRSRGGRSSSRSGQTQGTAQQPQAPALSREALVALMAETTLDEPGRHIPGKLNVNTVSEELLRKIFFGREHLADEIIFFRARPGGIRSMVDVADIPTFQEDTQALQQVARIMDVSSNVYTISAVGRAWAGGAEVEIIAVVDRSVLPVRILEYREQ
jgi:type II secretory pathway component PulK